MKEYKLVFSGMTGAGKTTAINVISDTKTISTDVENTDASLNKSHTTVGMDFGQVNLPNGDRLRLFGTPGQSRFDFMWKVLVKDAFGLIILIDNSSPDPLADLDLYLEGFKTELENTPCVVGVGRSEKVSSPSLDDFSTRLEGYGLTIPVLAVDVRQESEVFMLLDIIMAQVEADFTA